MLLVNSTCNPLVSLLDEEAQKLQITATHAVKLRMSMTYNKVAVIHEHRLVDQTNSRSLVQRGANITRAFDGIRRDVIGSVHVLRATLGSIEACQAAQPRVRHYYED